MLLATDNVDGFARGIAAASLFVSALALVSSGVKDFLLDRARLRVEVRLMTVWSAGQHRDVVLVRTTNVGQRDTVLQNLWLEFGRPWCWSHDRRYR